MATTTKRMGGTTATKPRRVSRVTVAKDVLKLLASKKLVAEAGTYTRLVPKDKVCVWDLDEGDKVRTAVENFGYTDTRKNLRTAGVRCQVCALGAAFCAYVMRVNNTTSEFDREKLKEVFPPLQLDQMESAFEQDTCYNSASGIGGEEARIPSVLFGNRYGTDAARLRAIMKNVIANRGDFVPQPRRRKVAA